MRPEEAGLQVQHTLGDTKPAHDHQKALVTGLILESSVLVAGWLLMHKSMGRLSLGGPVQDLAQGLNNQILHCFPPPLSPMETSRINKFWRCIMGISCSFNKHLTAHSGLVPGPKHRVK